MNTILIKNKKTITIITSYLQLTHLCSTCTFSVIQAHLEDWATFTGSCLKKLLWKAVGKRRQGMRTQLHWQCFLPLWLQGSVICGITVIYILKKSSCCGNWTVKCCVSWKPDQKMTTTSRQGIVWVYYKRLWVHEVLGWAARTAGRIDSLWPHNSMKA